MLSVKSKHNLICCKPPFCNVFTVSNYIIQLFKQNKKIFGINEYNIQFRNYITENYFQRYNRTTKLQLEKHFNAKCG